MAQDSGGLFFRLSDGNTHESYTKRSVLDALSGLDFLNSSLYAAGVFILSRGAHQEHFCETWLRLLTQSDYGLVIDSDGQEAESPRFTEHRHDQSILSLLLENESFAKIPDETFFSPSWTSLGASFPVWASRNKSGFRFSGEGLMGKTIRFGERKFFELTDHISGNSNRD
jgi:hypothetical protein